MPSIRIENVVATTALNTDLELPSVAVMLENAEYEPEQFPGVVYRIRDPKTAVLLFRSGKMVCTGAKSVKQVHHAVEIVVKELTAAGVKVDPSPEVHVQNIVASSDLESDLNLNAIAISLGLDRIEYEPEQFPGLVYRLHDPAVVALLFGSGKIVCTGAKTVDDLCRAVQRLQEDLGNAGLLRPRGGKLTPPVVLS